MGFRCVLFLVLVLAVVGQNEYADDDEEEFELGETPPVESNPPIVPSSDVDSKGVHFA